MKNLEQQTDTPLINEFYNKVMDIDPQKSTIDDALEDSLGDILQRISFIF